MSNVWHVRSAVRYRNIPDIGNYDIGFRLVIYPKGTLPEEGKAPVPEDMGHESHQEHGSHLGNMSH